MQDTPINRAILGGVLILVGLALVIFHERFRKSHDALSKHDPILRHGDWWTGKYTRGGLLFTRAITIIFGLALLSLGVSILLRWGSLTFASDTSLDAKVASNLDFCINAVLKGFAQKPPRKPLLPKSA